MPFDISGLRRKIFDSFTGGTPPDGFNPGSMNLAQPIPGTSPFDPRSIQTPIQSVPEQDILSQLGGFATPEQDKYQALLSARPERESPGLLRATVAAGMGLGARDPVKTQEEVMYAPYNRKFADWQSQVEPAYRGAQLENVANANERQLQTSILTNETNTKRYEAQAERDRERNRITEENNTARNRNVSDKNSIEQEWRRGTTFKKEGDSIFAYRKDGTAYDTGLRASNFNAMELERLKHRGDMEEIDARGKNAVTTKQTVPGANPKASTTKPANYSVRRNELLKRLHDNPRYTALITPSSTATGDYQLAAQPPKSTYGFARNPEKYQAYDEIQAELKKLGPDTSPLEGMDNPNLMKSHGSMTQAPLTDQLVGVTNGSETRYMKSADAEALIKKQPGKYRKVQ